MIEALDDIEARTSSENPFLGTKNVEKGRKMLAEMSAQTPTFLRARLLSELGWVELLQGLERDAINHFEAARQLFEMTAEGRQSDYYRETIGSLALAYLRLAETENCCAKPSPESCIFPLRNLAIHDQTEGSERALPLLRQLADDPNLAKGAREEASWLANIALMTLGRSGEELPERMRIPPESLESEPGRFPEFRNIAAKAGVDTFGLSGGAVMDDFDGDGFFDLIVSQWDPAQPTLYFRNRRDGTFENLTSEANLSGIRGGLNLRQTDFDNDGDLDVFIMRGAWMSENGKHPNSLLRNDGVDRNTGAVIFTDITFASGLGDAHYPTQTGDWADFDLDGDLDLFVGNETNNGGHFPCQLFRNEGPDDNGITQFTEIANEAGLAAFAYVKGAVWGDYDGDRYPDLFLSCINEANHLFRNRADGTFEDVTAENGVAMPERSFPTWFWDFNNDGNLDLFVSSYLGTSSEVFRQRRGEPTRPESLAKLFQGDGRGGFEEVGRRVGLTMPMLPMGSNFGDVMNDGFPDMYLGTGNPSYSSIVPNLFLSNEQGQFVDRTLSTRLGHLQKGHAVSIADFDRDGDLDIFEQVGGAYPGDPYYDALFENPVENGNCWVSIRLKGTKSNSFGVGSRVRVVVPDGNDSERSIYQWMNSGSSFGANPLELHFGLADAKHVLRVEVFWPVTGKTQVIEKVNVNQRIEITEK
ncbi:MAG: CRTAC1 family protein [Verrucomicrobiae bacterium]|nr:CRTAC1 family protein [Verrucomicrobiae bacterium]